MNMIDAMDEPVTEAALAKVNLYLHVTGKRADGYHLLESLVVFPKIGDTLSAERSTGLSLSVDGPFGDSLSADGDNLVLRAALAVQEASGTKEGAALHLTKSLPIASGIGGGSADAAAAMRALNRLWKLNLPEARLMKIGAALGADIPVCVRSRRSVFRGIGDHVSDAPAMPDGCILLVNPMIGVETRNVFAARAQNDYSCPQILPSTLGSMDELANWLSAETGNDLEDAAKAILPEIENVIAALKELLGVKLVRMSGSGATCFALFENKAAAQRGADEITSRHPTWWAAASEF